MEVALCPQITDGAGSVRDLLALPRVPFKFKATCYHFTALWDSVTSVFTCSQVNKLSFQQITWIDGAELPDDHSQRTRTIRKWLPGLFPLTSRFSGDTGISKHKGNFVIGALERK